MFEARLAQGSVLKRLADAVKELVGQANFCVTSDAITLHAMDNSHVCLIHLKLASDLFQHYRCDRPMSMGLNMANLVKVLKCAGNDDIITLKAEDDGDILTLMFEPNHKGERVTDFELKLMSIDSEELGIPEQGYMAQVQMPAGEYQRIFKDLATIGDTVHIAAVKGSVKFTTHGEAGTANMCIRENTTSEKSEEDVSIEVEEPVTLNFALRYLNSFAKATPLSSIVKLSLTRDLPIAVEYQFCEGNGILKYFLAPKIEEEDAMEDDGESVAA